MAKTKTKAETKPDAATEYDGAIAEVIEALEGIALIKAPATEYLAALERAKSEIETWIDASIDAAKDDVKRERGE